MKLGILITLFFVISPSLSADDIQKTLENWQKGPWEIKLDKKLPNVLILGDSISMKYTKPVRAILQGKANVFRPIGGRGKWAVNCEGTTFGLKCLQQWLKGQKWDVIHFNWGLHDLKHVLKKDRTKNSKNYTDPRQVNPDIYEKNLKEIVSILKSTGAKLIFATTTPVPENVRPVARLPEDVIIYNEIATKIMKENKIEINDLYSLALKNLSDWQIPHNVHFKDNGALGLAAKVAEIVQASCN